MIVLGSYGDEPVNKYLNSVPLLSAHAEVPISSKKPSKSVTTPAPGLLVPCTGCSEPYSQGTGECQDFDGDGVANKCDIDDDNDGVLDSQESYRVENTCQLFGELSHLNHVVNGSFEDGNTGFTSTYTFGNAGVGCSGYDIENSGWVSSEGTCNPTGNHMDLNADCTDPYTEFWCQTVTVKPNTSYRYGLSMRHRNQAAVALLVDNVQLGSHPTTSTWTTREVIFNSGSRTSISLCLKETTGVGGSADFGVDDIYLIENSESGYILRDTDNDGMANQFDNDSDGDGCSDSFEAGAINSEVPDHRFSSSPDMNSNGLNDNVENGTTGQTNYSSTYTPYALNNSVRLCEDTDNDGVNDLSDIDIDNDGVINSIESPSCFYTAREFESGNRRSFVKVTTGLTMNSTYNAPNELVDGDAGTATTSYAVQFANAQTITSGSNIYTFEFLMPVKLKNIYLGYANTNSHFGTGSAVKLQGSNNGSTWTDLNSGTTYGTTNSSGTVLNQGSIRYNQFTVASGSEARYRFYRIAGVSGTTSNNGLSNEVCFEVAPDYVASLNPKPSCTGDPDGDGDANHFDLDSDGDTCPDVYESSVPGATKGTGTYTDNVVVDPATPTAGVGTNGFKNSLETATDSNIPNFSSTYFYSLSNALNKCADTDNDGTVDLEDIDMDNDGIVNATESPGCFYTAVEMAVPQNVTTQIPTTGTVSNLYDDSAGTTFAFTSTTAANALGKSIFEITPKYPQAATAIILNLNTATSPIGTLSSSATLRAEGWNGSSWVALATFTASPAVSSNVQTFAFASNTTEYLKYRLFESGTNGVAIGTNAIREVKLRMPAGYVQSANPKPSCSQDTDGDTIYNHLDLDSDGDGCSDLVEASVSPGTDVTDAPATNNSGGSWGIDDPAGAQLNPAGTDANDDGLNDSVDTGTDGRTDYISTYGYAVDGNTNACQDSDGDGIKDIIDIDDDNDGVLDKLEMLCNDPETLTPTITAVNGTVVDKNELSYWETAQDVVIDFPYSFEKFNALFWSVDTDDNYTVSVRLDDGTLVGPIDGRLFSSTSDPSWVNRWTTKGYPVASSDVNWAEPLGEYSGAPFNPGEVFYTSTYPNSYRKSWGAVEFTIPQATQVNGIDKIVFTIKPGVGATAFVEIEPLNILSPCTDLDTDNDGIPNRLDLDSDGDGCSDLVEAGVSPGTDVTNAAATNNEGKSWGIENPEGAQLATEGTDANNDGLNDSVDTDQNGQTDYNSTYNRYALTLSLDFCQDTDNDGRPDIEDIDDDNDGILDILELSPCGMKLTYNNTLSGVDRGGTGGANRDFVYNSGGNWSLTLTFNTPKKIIIESTIGDQDYTRAGEVTVGNTIKTFNVPAGSFATVSHSPNINSTYTVGFKPTAGSTHTTLTQMVIKDADFGHVLAKFDFGTSTSPVESGCTGVNQTSSGTSYSFLNCLDLSTDSDGLPNRQDLDSDDDGCPDVYEARVPGATKGTGNYTDNVVVDPATPTAGVGTNGYKNTLETATDNGIPNFTASYYYAISQTLNLCADSDNDGIIDIEDIDDDNDGIFDVNEQTCTTSNIASATSKSNIVITKPNTINYTFNGNQTLANLVDGTDSNTLVIHNPTGTLSNAEWFRVEFPAPKILTSWEVGHYSNHTLFSTTSTYKVQGSKDGASWSDLTGTLTYSNMQSGQSTQANNSNVAQFPNNKIAYKFYRYFGVSGAKGTGWATEFFFVERNCNDSDTDSDGVLNRQDLDSDGDRCPDAGEAGVLTYMEGIAGAVYSSGNVINLDMSFNHPEAVAGPGPANPAAYGANGFYNSIESNDLSNATYTNANGYTYGNALDPSIASCICYEVPVTEGTTLIPLHGTTTLNRSGVAMAPIQWLEPRTGAHLVLESKTKGFVITRIASPETAITAPVPGMTVYDTDDNCIKIYVDDTDQWQCFSVQTCND